MDEQTRLTIADAAAIGDAVLDVGPAVGTQLLPLRRIKSGTSKGFDSLDADDAQTIAVEHGIGTVAGAEAVGVEAQPALEMVVAPVAEKRVVPAPAIQTVSGLLSLEPLGCTRAKNDLAIRIRPENAVAPAIDEERQCAAIVTHCQIDIIPVAIDRPAVPFLRIGLVHPGRKQFALEEIIVVIHRPRVELHLPRKHRRTVSEIVLAQFTRAARGIVEIEFPVGVVIHENRFIAEDDEGVEIAQGITVGQALRAGLHGFGSDFTITGTGQRLDGDEVLSLDGCLIGRTAAYCLNPGVQLFALGYRADSAARLKKVAQGVHRVLQRHGIAVAGCLQDAFDGVERERRGNFPKQGVNRQRIHENLLAMIPCQRWIQNIREGLVFGKDVAGIG